MKNTKKIFWVKFVVCLLVLIEAVFADVSVEINATSQPTATFKNNTNQSWRLGGFRYETSGGQWTGVDDWQMSYMILNHNPEELYYKSTAPSDNMANLKAGSNITWTHKWVSGLNPPTPKGEVELLLKTGAPGIPDEPAEYEPITVEQINEIIKNPDFYRESYRYENYDSLGSNGGKYSGGFMDTYVGQTQLRFAIPKGNSIRGAAAMRGDGAPAYYMALAMGQEYLKVDAQWMFAMGAKESWSGTMVDYGDTWNGQNIMWSTGNQAVGSGNYTSWHVEFNSGNDRALGYPHFFPKYENALGRARDVTTLLGILATDNLIPSGSTAETAILNYYVGGYDARYSPRSINGLFVSATFQYVNYDVLAYSTDICWKYALENAADPYMGLAAMVSAYNLGMWGQIGTIKGALNNANVDNAINDPNARNRFAEGNNNYRGEILQVAQALINASNDAEKGSGANSEIIDFKITLDQLRSMFFGTNGTVEKQGDGGILLHYYDPETGKDFSAIRQKIWNSLTEAFEILKGRASTSDANTISYRYDFLTAIRTVKAELPYERRFQVNGDASTLVPQNSTSGCSKETGGIVDETYPKITKTDIVPNETICSVYVDMTDNAKCKQVKWSIDETWFIWNIAEMIGNPSTSNTFKIAVPIDMADAFGKIIWIMAEDASGNSVIVKRELRFIKEFKKPEMKSAAVYDTTGDGYPNLLKAKIIKNDLSSLTDAKYWWSWESIIKQPITNTNISTKGDSVFFDISSFNSKDGAGSGMLYMEYDSLDQDGNKTAIILKDSIKIEDICGPAIKRADYIPYPIGDNSKPDTLIIDFTEEIAQLTSADKFIIFAKDDQGTDAIAIDVIDFYEEDGKWVFLYKSDIIAPNREPEYFYVKINFETQLTDNSPQKNKALENNRWVFINPDIKSAITPDFISAEMFDTWGEQNGRLDGMGDYLYVKMEKSEEEDAYEISNIDSLWLIFGNNTVVIKKSDNIISELPNSEGFGFFVKKNNENLISTNSNGQIKIFFSNDKGNEDILSGEIEDKIAPVIIEANYTRFDDRADTLKVKFSEKISNTGDSPIDAISGFPNTKFVSFSEDFAIYSIENGNLVFGDSIWIKSNTGVKDLLGNEQISDDNQRIEINYFRFISFSLKKAAYFDTNNPADGYIDLITAEYKFDTDADEDAIKAIAEKFVLNENRKFSKIKATDINVNLTEKSLEIKVFQNKDSVSVKTDIDNNDKISLIDSSKVSDTLGFLANINIPIDDSIAPIITKGRFGPMRVESDDTEIIDTLEIWFSEKVSGRITKEMLKALKFSNNAEYEISIDEQYANNDDFVKFLVKFDALSDLPEPSDSIRIEYGVSDNKRNEQKVKTIWAPLEIGKYIYSYNIMIYPNPYSPNNPVFDGNDYNPALENYYGNSKNMAVIIKPFGNRKLVGELSGKIVILDNIGNKIVDSNEFDFKNGALIWSWSGKNSRKRNVGAGLYQAIIQINNESANQSQTISKKIGIRN